MDFHTYVDRLDAKIHEVALEPDALIGVVWVNESAAIWSGKRGFAEVQQLSASMVAFALHEEHGEIAQTRFGDDVEGDLDAAARRIAEFLIPVATQAG